MGISLDGWKGFGYGKGEIAPPELAKAAEVGSLVESISDRVGVSITDKQERRAHRQPLVNDFFAIQESMPDLKVPWTEGMGVAVCGSFKGPFMIKHEPSDKGKRKYFIESEKQFEKFKAWFSEYGESQSGWVAQEFIECPGKSWSSIRVLVDFSGNIMASQIIYGAPKEESLSLSRKKSKKDSTTLLESSDSEFFLDCRVVASNVLFDFDQDIDADSIDDFLVGGRIVLNPKPNSHSYSEREVGILKAYGLDQDNPRLPLKVAKQAQGIAQQLCVEGDVVENLFLGLDFLQNKEGEVFWVERNGTPTMASIKDLYGGIDSVSDIAAYQLVFDDIIERVKLDPRELKIRQF